MEETRALDNFTMGAASKVCPNIKTAVSKVLLRSYLDKIMLPVSYLPTGTRARYVDTVNITCDVSAYTRALYTVYFTLCHKNVVTV